MSKIEPKIKTGVSLPASLVKDLDYLAGLTQSSRSMVITAVCHEIISESVVSLRKLQKKSTKSSPVPIVGFESAILSSILAYKAHLVTGEIDFSSFHAEDVKEGKKRGKVA